MSEGSKEAQNTSSAKTHLYAMKFNSQLSINWKSKPQRFNCVIQVMS